jgi:GNAT superfamily N-acetyltransferase
MSSDKKGRIIKYKPSMAEQAAEMFNKFNELWPGGFGGGVPYTAERVHDWLDKTSAIADLFAVREDGVLAGYCGLYPHWRDKNAAYITILGVTPEAKGKKFGKRLLLKSLEIAKEKGIYRVDLNTWSGNMDAVPLYKKVGLFWVPETQVYMQDYIPGLMQNTFAKEWFDKHPDWYGNFKRDLSQKPDKEIVEGMELYTYHFQEGDDELIAFVDRYGWGFCGFTRKLDEEEITVKTKLQDHNIFVGIKNAFTVILENKSKKDQQFSLSINTFQGFDWFESFPQSIEVKAGETKEVTREFVITKSVTLFKGNNLSSEKLETRISFDNYTLNLLTGGKIQSAVQLKKEQSYQLFSTESELEIIVDLVNNTDKNLSGTIDYYLEGLANSHRTVDFSIEANNIDGVSLLIILSKSSLKTKYVLKAMVSISDNNKIKREMPVFTYYLLANKPSLLEYLPNIRVNEVEIITSRMSITAELEGGRIRINPNRLFGGMPIRHETGPPFGISLDRTLKYDYTIKQSKQGTLLILTASSRQLTGIQIKKYLQVAANSTEVEYWVEYLNTSLNESIHVGARTGTGSGGLNLNPLAADRAHYLPIYGEIIKTDPVTYFINSPMVSSDPNDWQETWTARESDYKKMFHCWIWRSENIQKIKVHTGDLSYLESKTMKLSPGEVYKPVHLWYCFNVNSLEEVRNLWVQRTNQKALDSMELLSSPKCKEPFNFEIKGVPILVKGQSQSITLEISSFTNYPLKGSLTLNLPDNWKGVFLADGKEVNKYPMPELEPTQTEQIKLKIVVPESHNGLTETITVHFSGEFEINFNYDLLLVDSKEKENVKINKTNYQEAPIYQIDNGYCSFKVAAQLGGNLFDLRDKQDQPFLYDSFPNIEPRFFIEKSLGGIYPSLFSLEDNIPYTEPQKTTSKIVEEGLWRGIETTWTINKEDHVLRGQRCSTQYLTLPSIPVIKIRITQKNNSDRQISNAISLMGDIALGGSNKGNIIETEIAGQLWERNPSKNQFIAQSVDNKKTIHIKKEKQSLTILQSKDETGSIATLDLGVMLISLLLKIVKMEPHSEQSFEIIIVLNEGQETAKAIQRVL